MEELKCYFDVSIGGRDSGRIVFKLFKDICPKTCENFRCLCTGERGNGHRSGKPLHYKGSPFHRVVRNFIIQGGDITHGNGKGGDSIYGGSFADENLDSAHDEPYLLSMANRGPNTNKSQFFITTNEAPHLDGKHVVFGRVVSGLDTIVKIERQEVDAKSRPLKEVIIKDCGQLTVTDQRSNQQDTVNDGKKRKLSNSSRSSDDLSIARKTKSKTKSQSSPTHSHSCSTISSKCGSSYSGSSVSHTSLSKQPRRKRSPSYSGSSRSSSSSSSRTSDSGSGSSRSNCSDASNDRSRVLSDSSGSCKDKSQESSSDSSCSSSSPYTRSRKRHKTNRRLAPTRKLEDFRALKDSKKVDEDIFINPHYKCSVQPDEIPQVPVNRFLMRGFDNPSRKHRNSLVNYNTETEPIEVDLSKFEDLPDDANDVDLAQSVSLSSSSNHLRSRVKATEPLVSKSGRIMRGRGTFKFRTPSPGERYRDADSFSSRRATRSYRSRSRSRDDDRSPRYYHNGQREKNCRRRRTEHKSSAGRDF